MFRCLIAKLLLCGCQSFFIKESYLLTRLAIVTGNELELAFPPRNLPEKFRPDPSTFYLVIMVTNKQADKQTNQRR